jgi:DNA-binding CsgD family transcriptional regulator
MTIDPATILENLEQYVFCKDASCTYIYANEQFARIAGIDCKDSIVGKTDKDLVWHQQAALNEAKDKEVLAGTHFIREQEIQIRKSGPARILMTKRPLHSEHGDIIGVVGSFFDCQNSLILEAKGKFDSEKRRFHLGFVPETLSFSEVRTCFYLLHGFSVEKISEKSGITVSTVRYHIENIKSKMGCRKKSEITEVAMRTGIAWKIMSLQHEHRALRT